MRLSEQREHHDEEHEPPNEGVTPPRPRDKKIDQAKAALLDELFPNGDEVYYAQQIEVHFEERFFHWITQRALKELVDEGAIRCASEELAAHLNINFYSSTGNRYWKRRSNKIGKLVLRYSEPSFTRGLGIQGEMMFDAALPTAGFLPRARNANEFNGREWKKTQ